VSGFTTIGVPIDSVGRAGGTEHAPAALRELGVVDALGARDVGDLPVRIRGEERDPVSGVIAVDDVLASTSAIRASVRAAVAAGERPFLLGGCCAELPGALAGARDALGRVGLAYVDGHLDLYDGVSSPTGEAADMPVAVALGFGPATWVETCGGPSVEAGDVAILGFRDLAESLADGMRDPASVEGLRLADVDAVRDGPAGVGEDVSAALAAGPGRFWFHLDVDVLDEEVFPATDYLFAGGLTWEELQPLLGPLLSSPSLLGASIGCYNPEKDTARRSGRELVTTLGLATG
jgi:arginase